MNEPRRLNWAQVVGTAVGGFVIEWCVIVTSVAVAAETNTGGPTVWVIGFLAMPLVCAVLLISPRTRVWGASVLVGLLLGSIVGAGVCSGFLLSLE